MSRKDAYRRYKESVAYCDKIFFHTSWNCSEEYLNEIKEGTIRLPLRVEYPRTTARGRFLQTIRRLGGRTILRGHSSLLDIALRNSRVLSAALRLSRSRTALQQVPLNIETKHRIMSEFEEEYSVRINLQKQSLNQLVLQLSLCNDVLRIRVYAPRHLWLSLSLEENCFDHFYGIQYT